MNILFNILMLCVEGDYLCERDVPAPQIKYYEEGKACYIEGVFHQSCPKRNYVQHTNTRNSIKGW